MGRRDRTTHPVRSTGTSLASITGIIVFLGALPAGARGQETAAYYKQNCYSCHTIGGGRLVGPDLKDVTTRQDRDWLVRFMLNPQGMIDRGDPYAKQILEEARGVVMPPVAGLSRDRANLLLDLIEAESALEKSQFEGVKFSDRPFTSEDVALGRRLFVGTEKFKNGGPSCISCHTVRGLTWLGGGRLGVDLTKASERIGGRRPLSAWLVSPATVMMQPVFKDHPLEAEEILPLVAFFEDAAKQVSDDDSVAPLTFFLIGLGGMVLVLGLFDVLWKDRFRAVRRPLVAGGDKRISV
ncbi:MAG: c-type cytochrome [Planctomycetota bacterium]|jgi:mono/diheme cytochrome c family protein